MTDIIWKRHTSILIKEYITENKEKTKNKMQVYGLKIVKKNGPS